VHVGLCSYSVKALKGKTRELERLLGRKTLENEILKDAIEIAREKNCCRGRPCRGRTIRGESNRSDARSVEVESDRAAATTVLRERVCPASACRRARRRRSVDDAAVTAPLSHGRAQGLAVRSRLPGPPGRDAEPSHAPRRGPETRARPRRDRGGLGACLPEAGLRPRRARGRRSASPLPSPRDEALAEGQGAPHSFPRPAAHDGEPTHDGGHELGRRAANPPPQRSADHDGDLRHLQPDYLRSEIDRLRFGSAPAADLSSASLPEAGLSPKLLTTFLQGPPTPPPGGVGGVEFPKGSSEVSLAGWTGLEPAASGVTGQRSRSAGKMAGISGGQQNQN
jgi:hypothetical protein